MSVAEETISVLDIVELVKRNAVSALFTIGVTSIIALIVAYQVPPKYKSRAVLSIQSTYFRNPLVSDFIPEAADGAELNSLRQSILRLALSDEFLDEMGERYQIYKSEPDTKLRIREREYLLQRIEYFSLNSTNFQISISGKNPEMVYEMNKNVLDRMTFTLIEERYKNLVRARDAIQAQVAFLSRALRDVDNSGHADYLQKELEKINANISALRSKYTESHPDLYKMRQKAESMKSRLREADAVQPELPEDDLAKAFITSGSKAPIQDIYNDLLKKLSHLNIILEMEKDKEKVSYLGIIEKPSVPVEPYFPVKKEFLLFGVAIGIGLAVLQTLYFELNRASYVSAEAASELLGVPFLGELPLISDKTDLLLIEGPLKKEDWTVLALPGKRE